MYAKKNLQRKNRPNTINAMKHFSAYILKKTRRYLVSPYGYLSCAFFLTATTSTICSQFVVWEPGNLLYPTLWLTGFTILTFDLSCSVLCAVYYPFTKSLILKEKDLSSIPSCAIVYPVRNESVGLYERIQYTLQNNNLPNTRLCFLSDSSQEFLHAEADIISKLRGEFGEEKIYYIHRKHPTNAKPGNIKNWLTREAHNYTYFFVCDADSLLPKDALLKLLRKAEHPENAHIAIFQTKMRVAHAKTIFSKHQEIGVDISQKLYTDVKQRLLGTSLSFGHGNLIRMNAFMNIHVPEGALSHDIWDMALLNKKGFLTLSCPDVTSYEEVPSNYLEMRVRDKRWIKGNFQSAPLLFAKNISIGARFYIFYGLFIYLCQPIFLSWIILTLLGNSSLFGQFLYFKPIIGSGPNPYYIETYHFATIILSAVYLHKFILCRNITDCILVLKELFFSTMISLNNIVYHTLDILAICFQNIAWIPMKKDPFTRLTFIKSAKHLWPGTILGLLMAFFIMHFSPHVTLIALPIIVSFSCSIPIVYTTSLPCF